MPRPPTDMDAWFDYPCDFVGPVDDCNRVCAVSYRLDGKLVKKKASLRRCSQRIQDIVSEWAVRLQTDKTEQYLMKRDPRRVPLCLMNLKLRTDKSVHAVRLAEEDEEEEEAPSTTTSRGEWSSMIDMDHSARDHYDG